MMRKVKAIITRTVKEEVILYMNGDEIEDFEVLNEIDTLDLEVEKEIGEL